MREAVDNPETIVLDDEIEAVNILTVHRAKGLEFKVVFITGLVAEKFPTRDLSAKIDLPDALIREKINKEESHIQEERRLFYVAMTRAKQELYLCSSQFYSSQRQRKISQFILEALDKPKAAIDRETRSVLEQIEMFSPNENEFPQTLSAKSAEILPLSFYHIDDYLTCPLKYKFVHILNVPLLPNHAILYGSALHSAVQAFDLAMKSKKKLSFKAMLAVLLGKWSSEGYISREHEEQRDRKSVV